MSIKSVYHPTILSSVVAFSSCLQSFPASGSFPMSQFFASGGQSIGVSASASVLPMNTQDWFPLELTGCISLQSKVLQESSPTPQFKSINLWLDRRVSLIFCGCSVFPCSDLPWSLVIIWGLACPLSSLSKHFPLFHSLYSAIIIFLVYELTHVPYYDRSSWSFLKVQDDVFLVQLYSLRIYIKSIYIY